MVSIVIPVYILNGQINEYAKRCIDSIKQNSKDIELIIIDNGGGQDFEKLADIYIKNKENLGYGPAINQGFKVSHGEFLCAMNDDVEVRPGWLELLTASFVNPLCAVVRPSDDKEIGNGLTEDYTWYHGFCWVMKRELWQSMKDKNANLLDEQYRIGNFEDLDLWKRILDRHMKLFKNHHVRVSHYGGLTIKQLDHAAQNAENERLFIDKHGMPNWREVFYP